MSPEIRVPFRLAIGLALAVALDTVVQLTWKTAATGIPEAGSPWAMAGAALKQPLFLVVCALLLCQLVNWLRVLHDSDLSFAQPITSLSRVAVCVASVLFLNERIAPAQIGGILIVCLGVWYISRSARETRAPEALPQ